MSMRAAVLASGRGSNLAALWEYLHGGGAARDGVAPAAAEIAVVLSDQPDARALSLARERGVPAVALALGAARDASLEQRLREHGVELVLLAGYLRLIPRSVVRAFRGRMLNVHPALLPAFGGPGMYGHRVHDAVLAAGARVSGATVHFVDEEFDRGAIVAQWPVPVFGDDDAAVLAKRVLRVEHALFPRVVQLVASGRVTLGEDGRAQGLPVGAARGRSAAFTLQTEGIDALADDIARALA